MKREPIAPNDAIWLQDSATNLMIINAVIVIDHLDLRTLRTAFRRRILEGEHAEAFARFRCRVGGSDHRPYWEPDPAFDLKRHIVAAREKHLHGAEAVQDYVGREANKELDPDHPLWQFQLITGQGEDKTVLLLRFHHSLGDGEALMGLLFSLVDEHPGKGRQASRMARTAQGERWLPQLMRTAALAMSAPGVLLRRLAWIPDRSPMHGPELSGTKRVAWTEPLDLEVVKRANQQIGATVNDVLMAAVSGAFSHYLLEHGGGAPTRFLVSMPVSVRALAKSTRCGNYFAPVPLELPAGAGVHGHRILAIKERMDELKGSPAPLVIYHLQRALVTCLPNQVSRFLIDFLANKCSAVVTNVKGPSRELALMGRKLHSIMFWVPQRARIGIGISILSCSGKVQVGVIADEALVPNPAELIQAFEDEFDTLKLLADLAPGQSPVQPAVEHPAPEDAGKPIGKRTPRPKAKPKLFQDEPQGAPALPEALSGPTAGELAEFVAAMEKERVGEEAALV